MSQAIDAKRNRAHKEAQRVIEWRRLRRLKREAAEGKPAPAGMEPPATEVPRKP